MIRPASWLAFCVHVRAPKEKSLYDEMLEFEFARLDFLVNPLMTRIKAARVASHRDKSCFFLNRNNSFSVGKRVCDRDFDLDMFAGAHALDRLLRMYLRWRGKNNCL